ncbi:MAG: HAMP domain-containing histidine kinase [Candidatus Moranbacteria bacterium]|nr:HAMP domain-containing histidine kinase [Candidatus Moranbacteria bacterium]NTW75493.1 HAMP domain-containing histidine kinase [Candidatus Moranbacteria bacterium]
MVIVFFLWAAADLATWVNVDARIVAFLWSLFGILNTLLFFLSLYFYLVFIRGDRDISFRTKIFLSVLSVPVLVLAPTVFNVASFNIVSCEAGENSWYENYYYFMGAVAFICVMISTFRVDQSGTYDERQKSRFMSLGIGLFLLLFFLTGYIAAMLNSFVMEQYGLFGMTIFLIFLGFLIAKFQVFNIRMLGAQFLVAAIILLTGARLFYPQTTESLILNLTNLVLTILAGFFLIRSVRKEVKRKEELQEISDSLAVANARLKELDNTKTEFISIASHQLRTPLTAIKGYLSLLLEESYGTLSVEVSDVLEKLNQVNRNLIQLVEDLLNVSRIDAGRIRYSFEPIHLESLVAERVDMFMPIARNRGIGLNLSLPERPLPVMMLDPGKMREAVSNLIDNSIKYTEIGTVTVTVELFHGDSVHIVVSDTGIGFRSEDGAKLFGKFVRTQETNKVYVSGTGLGLFVGKSFVEAHGGKMWAESDGPGKGSRFHIELPIPNPKASVGTGNKKATEK